jgi:hypothetical protein
VVVVVVDDVDDVVVGATEVDVTWRTSTVAVEAQAENVTATSAVIEAVRIGAIPLARRRPGVTAPPSRSDPRTARQG